MSSTPEQIPPYDPLLHAAARLTGWLFPLIDSDRCTLAPGMAPLPAEVSFALSHGGISLRVALYVPRHSADVGDTRIVVTIPLVHGEERFAEKQDLRAAMRINAGGEDFVFALCDDVLCLRASWRADAVDLAAWYRAWETLTRVALNCGQFTTHSFIRDLRDLAGLLREAADATAPASARTLMPLARALELDEETLRNAWSAGDRLSVKPKDLT